MRGSRLSMHFSRSASLSPSPRDFALPFIFIASVMRAASFFYAALILASSVTALEPLLDEEPPRPSIPYDEEPDDSVSVFHFTSNKEISHYKEIYYFDQLIDHRNPKLGTFKQRYWHNYEFYEPGQYCFSPLECQCAHSSNRWTHSLAHSGRTRCFT